uniref:Uncharacterized protein n=1 Tax=Arundo donax TaxID=35708 RepID=A0A0A9C6L7_ARUDO
MSVGVYCLSSVTSLLAVYCLLLCNLVRHEGIK